MRAELQVIKEKKAKDERQQLDAKADSERKQQLEASFRANSDWVRQNLNEYSVNYNIILNDGSATSTYYEKYSKIELINCKLTYTSSLEDNFSYTSDHQYDSQFKTIHDRTVYLNKIKAINLEKIKSDGTTMTPSVFYLDLKEIQNQGVLSEGNSEITTVSSGSQTKTNQKYKHENGEHFYFQDGKWSSPPTSAGVELFSLGP